MSKFASADTLMSSAKPIANIFYLLLAGSSPDLA